MVNTYYVTISMMLLSRILELLIPLLIEYSELGVVAWCSAELGRQQASFVPFT